MNKRIKKKLTFRNGYKKYKNYRWNQLIDEILEEIKQEEKNEVKQ